ncbi:MAG TPA: hypothetical protein VM029_13040 [Opitutaceae bacterium]|nr:hypothetical protein [Opitutaceae bacterium]
MSLINEALKKAQWQRSQEAGAVTPPVPGAEPGVVKRGKRQGNPLLLIGGGVALVLVAIVVTVLVVKRQQTKPVAIARAATSASAPTAAAPKAMPASTPAPIIIAPILKPIEPAPTPAAAPATASAPKTADVAPTKSTTVATAEKSPATLAPKLPVAETTPAAAATTSAAPSAPVASPAAEPAAPDAKGDERVYAFVDTIRVTGIRSSGGDSRVLMNEKVYRVNDIVDRSLGVRLIKVDADSLTFVDEKGAKYVKYF